MVCLFCGITSRKGRVEFSVALTAMNRLQFGKPACVAVDSPTKAGGDDNASAVKRIKV